LRYRLKVEHLTGVLELFGLDLARAKFKQKPL